MEPHAAVDRRAPADHLSAWQGKWRIAVIVAEDVAPRMRLRLHANAVADLLRPIVEVPPVVGSRLYQENRDGRIFGESSCHHAAGRPATDNDEVERALA
jgi:hypothetical protein